MKRKYIIIRALGFELTYVMELLLYSSYAVRLLHL